MTENDSELFTIYNGLLALPVNNGSVTLSDNNNTLALLKNVRKIFDLHTDTMR